jgi:hypothetical protein
MGAERCKNRAAGIKRIKPNILSDRFQESRAFYEDVIGLRDRGGLDWILFFGADQDEVQLRVMKLDIKARVHPAVSIEVDVGGTQTFPGHAGMADAVAMFGEVWAQTTAHIIGLIEGDDVMVRFSSRASQPGRRGRRVPALGT